MSIPDCTKAYHWWVNPFNGDYLKYVEAIFSNKECAQYYPNWYSEERKEELINNFLSNSKEYHNILQKQVNDIPSDWWIGMITNDISVFVWKIIDWIWIK